MRPSEGHVAGSIPAGRTKPDTCRDVRDGFAQDAPQLLRRPDAAAGMTRPTSPPTARHVRTALRAALQDAGFTAESTQFVHRTPALQHRVEVTGVRLLPGFVQMHHHIGLAGEPTDWHTEELASHGHGSGYPRIWSAAAVDVGLVLAQVTALRDAFRGVADVAHFCADEPDSAPSWAQANAAVSVAASSLSAAECRQALRHGGHALLGPGFDLLPPTETFDLWAARAEHGGFRHGAYLEANAGRTQAVVVVFALPAVVFARGFRHDDARRRLWQAPKQVLFDAGRPVLLPLRPGAPVDAAAVGAALTLHLARHPPDRPAQHPSLLETP